MKLAVVSLLLLFSVSAFALPSMTPGLDAVESGPIFHERSPMKVSSYQKKEKKALSSMSSAELASVGVSVVGGKFVDSAGNILSGSTQRTAITTRSFNQSATAGRYLYTGNVPRFSREALEIAVSKTFLTVRIKGWVSESLMAGYRFQQLYRWKRIYDAFQDGDLSFVKVKDPNVVYNAAKDSGTKSWLTIAMQYMKQTFEGTGLDLYAHTADTAEEYKKNVLTTILRTILGSTTAEIADGLNLYAQLAASPEARAADAAASRELFIRNVGMNFTPTSERAGYVGFATYVYPIAGSTNGAFSLPSEGLINFGSGGTFIESRAWSDVWNDEFGGLPFMEVISGVGFHGPITNKAGIEAWYLRRGYVSHGCFRMDASDVMEFRMLLPTQKNMKGKGVAMKIMSWPDVTDVNADGKMEAVDVGYYEIPPSADAKTVPTYMLPNVQKKYWKDHFVYLNGQTKNAATGEKNSFDPETATFRNIPKYDVVGGKLTKTGSHSEVSIFTFPARATAVIQYRDVNARYNSGAYEDSRGKYSPTLFNNIEWVEPVVAPAPTPAAQ